jgi:hypothetical protein
MLNKKNQVFLIIILFAILFLFQVVIADENATPEESTVTPVELTKPIAIPPVLISGIINTPKVVDNELIINTAVPLTIFKITNADTGDILSVDATDPRNIVTPDVPVRIDTGDVVWIIRRN